MDKLLDDFERLRWSKLAHFCDDKANFVNYEQVSDPDYDPWILAYAHKEYKISQTFLTYYFLYNPNLGKVFCKMNSETFVEISPNHKLYQVIIDRFEDLKVNIDQRHFNLLYNYNVKIKLGYGNY